MTDKMRSSTVAVRAEAGLLHLLMEARAPMTLEAIGRALGCSAVEAAVRVEAVEGLGCAIDRHPQHGVRLVGSSLTCWSDYIEARHAGGLGCRLRVYRETTSTQDLARQLVRLEAAAGGCHGHVLVADHQTAGRGRLDRRWTTPPGAALLMTVMVESGGASVDRLMLAACTAVADLVEGLTPLATQVRWPNDILVDGRKLAGILVETLGDVALVGIGINVHAAPQGGGQAGGQGGEQKVLRSPATSLAQHGHAVDRLRLLDHLLARLQPALYDRTSAALHAAWRRRAALLQQRVTVHAGSRRLTGRVIDLDPTAGLLLQLDRGQVVTLPAQTTSLALDT